MEGSGPYIQLLAQIPAFAVFDDARLQMLYSFCALKVLAKGEAASIAGESVDELGIVVTGRIATRDGTGNEAGRGQAVEVAAFLMRTPARVTAVALRETVLLTLGWEDLAAAFQACPDLIGTVLSRMGAEHLEADHARPVPSRIVICPAGAGARLDHRAKDALLAGLESVAEIRVLTRQSFGAGMPGALALESPEIAHWLQEQELEFDLTLIVADATDLDFAAEAIEEADEVLFIAGGEDPGLSALERHALEARGAANCRLVFQQSQAGPVKRAAEWVERRGYGRAQAVDFASPAALQLMGAGLAGKGQTIAAASAGVYAAAILGALQALEEHGMPAVSLVAAGSAVLPAGLLACGKLGTAHAIFEELANPTLWKRASRPEAGLFDPVPLDNFLVGALQGLEIPAASRPFAAVSRSLSAGAAEVHRTGRLHGAVRAGIAPPGMLPPLIVEGGDILVSGENEALALLRAAGSLGASPVLSIRTRQQPLGPCPMSYRNLTGSALFRAAQAIDKRVLASTVLGAVAGSPASAAGGRAFVLPMPEGVSPMDWPQWAALRNMGYEWTLRELEAQAGFE
jgi:NTE family protein